MKKLFLTFAAVCAVVAVSAQEFSWGPKVGVNVTSLYGKNVSDDVQIKAGFVGGAFVEYKTCKWFGVGAEALYSGQGYSLKESDASANFHYINVPILANFHVTKFLALKTGIQPGFMVSASAKNGVIDKNEFNTFDLSIPVAIEFQLNCGLLFDLRYNVGVTTVAKEAKAYNDVFALTVGWRF